MSQIIPLNAAGRRTEPPVSVHNATGTICSATATADPLDDHQATRLSSIALCGIG